MKHPVLLLLASLLVSTESLAFVIYPPHPFCDQVDAAWSSGEYKRIKNLIDERLSERPEDPMALSMACHYYVFVERDAEQYTHYVDRLKALAEDFSITAIFEGEMGKLYDTSEKALSEFSRPFTNEEKEEIAKAFPDEFPGTLMAFMMAKFFIEHVPSVHDEFETLYSSYVSTTKKKVIDSQAVLRSSATSLVDSEKPSDVPREEWHHWRHIIDESKWPQAISELRPMVVYWSEKGISIALYKFVSNSEGIFVYSEDVDPSTFNRSSSERMEEITTGIYWFRY